MLEPNRDQIEIFVDAIFRHAQAGFFSLRAFVEGTNHVFRKTSFRVVSNNLKFLVDAVEDDARRAAQYPKPIVFCPPLATFGNDKTATEQDIVEGFTVTVECDERPDVAREKLETILGPATTVIRSGGVWNDGNGVTQDKLHLHWRLAKPARGRDDLIKLKRVREICAHLVGADPTSIPICHPIRWPGSWHRKTQPRLTEIIACDPDIEIDLDAALAMLEPLAPAPPRSDNRAAQPGGEWDVLTANILAGKLLHHSTTRLAMKLLRGGTPEVMAVQMLRALLDASAATRDDRWRDRYAGIPRAVSSAGRKLADEQEEEKEAAAAAQPKPPPQSPPPPPPPIITPAPAAAPGPSASSPIEQTLQAFERWLILPSRMPVYAMLGTVAANLLPGDPTWLGLIAPPSSAKTELINALTGLPFVVTASTLTPAGLLSGTPRRQRAAGAKGGLLPQAPNPGLLCIKDFTSILTMRPDAKAEILGALRDVYDGHYIRRLGSDGGRELEWKGKLGLIFACTNVIDTHYSVENALGNRFLLSRSEPNRAQFKWALKHTGASFTIMRRELADCVNALFALPRPDPQPLDPEGDEFKRLDRIVNLVVRLRGAVERDRYKRDIQSFHGAEGPGRIGLALERLLAGLDTLGVDRQIALDVVEAVALDSATPIRRKVYEYLCEPLPGTQDLPWRTTTEVAKKVRLPAMTVRRTLEELFGYDLCEFSSRGKGQTSIWRGVLVL